MDHDQRFKVLFREFPHDFFKLFFPGVARQFDFSRLEWIETELFPDPPEGERRAVDLVAKLPLKGHGGSSAAAGPTMEELLALIHVEIESSESPAEFGRRMLWYYMSLRQRHGLPVLPVAVFLKAGKHGLGRERHVERCGRVEVVRFDYLTVGLQGLDSLQYVGKPNRLAPAMAALMKIPDDRRAEVKLEAYDRIVHSRLNELQRFLLLNCVDAYLTLNEADAARFQGMLHARRQGETETMVQTAFEKREALGLEKGLEKGRRHMILLLLQERMDPVPDSVRRRVEEWPADDLENLFLRILRAQPIEELGL